MAHNEDVSAQTMAAEEVQQNVSAETTMAAVEVQHDGSINFTNLFIKNLSESTTEDDLKNVFKNYGDITSSALAKDENGNSRCFGFVNYATHESAAAAVEALNGSSDIDGNTWFVGRAQAKLERIQNLQGANLYLKNLEDEVDDEKLREMFAGFGTITSVKVMVDEKGASRGFGFVAFSSPEEAAKAKRDMNGKMIGRKPLYVAVAQRKEERVAKLQAHFAQLQTRPRFVPPAPAPAQQILNCRPVLVRPMMQYYPHHQHDPARFPAQFPARFPFRHQELLPPSGHPRNGPMMLAPPPQRSGPRPDTPRN